MYYFRKKENSLGRVLTLWSLLGIGYHVFIVYYYPNNMQLAWVKISAIYSFLHPKNNLGWIITCYFNNSRSSKTHRQEELLIEDKNYFYFRSFEKWKIKFFIITNMDTASLNTMLQKITLRSNLKTSWWWSNKFVKRGGGVVGRA